MAMTVGWDGNDRQAVLLFLHLSLAFVVQLKDAEVLWLSQHISKRKIFDANGGPVSAKIARHPVENLAGSRIGTI